jgi:hypothetical protein
MVLASYDRTERENSSLTKGLAEKPENTAGYSASLG